MKASEVAPLSLSYDFKEENVSFSLPPQQGIASAEIDFKCPKSDLEYETSHLEIHSTYLPIHHGKPQDVVAALPELEEHIEAKVFEKDLKLDSLSSQSRSIFGAQRRKW